MATSSFLLILSTIVSYIPSPSHSQTSQWLDPFQRDLCHNRWMQMDWQSILRPCRNNMEFGKNIQDEKERTSAKWSHTSGLHFKRTGEFSKITIQSRTSDGRIKRTGGDTWRLFIRGPEKMTPFVSDLDNGVYEAKFMFMKPGLYKAEIVLESSLCEAFKDPPQDWLKRDATTILDDEKNSKLTWEPLRGGNISFKIEASSKEHLKGLQRRFHQWKDTCGAQYQCGLLWKGFGRWVNDSWLPYIDENYGRTDDDQLEGRCLKQKEGLLKMTGDDMISMLSNYSSGGSLCNDVFESCEGPRLGEQPDSLPFSQRDETAKVFSTKAYTKALKTLLARPDMDEKSGLLLNYGYPFVQNMNFKQYRTFIDRVARIVKEKYKGKAVWRTMPSLWRESDQPSDHFRNHQREMLFNAYATSAMCNAGVPALDVYQMNEARPHLDENEILTHVNQYITEYYQNHPSKECTRSISNTTSAENTTMTISTGELPLTDGSSPSLITAGINAANNNAQGPVLAEATGGLMGIPKNMTTDNLVAAMETSKPADVEAAPSGSSVTQGAANNITVQS